MGKDILYNNPITEYVLVCWDIDKFKILNDICGSAEGDRFLGYAGKLYIDGFFRDQGAAVYGHWGADHFVMLCEKSHFDPEVLSRKLPKKLSEAFPNHDFITRMGIYDIKDRELDIVLMCDRAFMALKATKDLYDTRYLFFRESMRYGMLEEQEILRDMKSALESGQFIPYFQPQYNYETGVITGAEVLMRWKHPEKGILLPSKFISVFERNGIITPVDITIWDQACALMRKWLDDGIDVPNFSINVSRVDLYDPYVCDLLVHIAEKYGIDHSMLHIEITESAYMENPAQLIKRITQLNDNGFYVEMDDFGSGYSSLNMLKDMPVDLLKLDMNFVKNNKNNNKSGTILSSVVHMAHSLDLRVIAEGVETKSVADFLKSIGCVYMQGYYFSKPVSADSFEKMLKETKKPKELSRFSAVV